MTDTVFALNTSQQNILNIALRRPYTAFLDDMQAHAEALVDAGLLKPEGDRQYSITAKGAMLVGAPVKSPMPTPPAPEPAPLVITDSILDAYAACVRAEARGSKVAIVASLAALKRTVGAVIEGEA